jgi:hypothetical protein
MLTVPFTPLVLFQYGCALAGGLAACGITLLLLLAAWFWLLGGRR